MIFGDAQELTMLLQRQIGDSSNIVIKKQIAQEIDPTMDSFSVCVRRVTFAPPLLVKLIEFAVDHQKQFVVRNADIEFSPDEKYQPVIGEWKYASLVGVIY